MPFRLARSRYPLRIRYSPTERGIATSTVYHDHPVHRRSPNVLEFPRESPTLLPLVLSASNLHLPQAPWNFPGQPHLLRSPNISVNEETVVPFFLSEALDNLPIGFLRPKVLKALTENHNLTPHPGGKSPFALRYSEIYESDVCCVSFASWVNKAGKDARTTHLEQLVLRWKDQNLFPDILRGWSNEAFPVYHHAPKTLCSALDPVAFTIERAALPLFGFPNFGSLLIAHFRDTKSGQTMIWVPRRSQNKKTWPGKLDVTVGGGISFGNSPMSTIVRESAEEACLDEHYVREYICPTGVLPFPNRSPAGWILPGLYYTFDLPLPPDGSVCPKTNMADGEVESFELMDVQTVLELLLKNEFKNSSALALVDFLIRHGHVTSDSDPRFIEVCSALKTPFTLSSPWW